MRTRGILCLLLLCATTALAQKMERPVYNVGDTWVYEQKGGNVPGRYVHKVTSKTGDGGYQITSTSPRRTSVTTFNADGNALDVNGRRIQPYRDIWRFPLEVGKPYEGQPYQYPHTRRNITIKATATVRSITMEKVTTPAGTFDAFRVEVRIAYQYEDAQGYFNSQDRIYWMDPAVGRFVKFHSIDHGSHGSGFELQLLEYKRAS